MFDVIGDLVRIPLIIIYRHNVKNHQEHEFLIFYKFNKTLIKKSTLSGANLHNALYKIKFQVCRH